MNFPKLKQTLCHLFPPIEQLMSKLDCTAKCCKNRVDFFMNQDGNSLLIGPGCVEGELLYLDRFLRWGLGLI